MQVAMHTGELLEEAKTLLEEALPHLNGTLYDKVAALLEKLK